jgi:hypothetical protein
MYWVIALRFTISTGVKVFLTFYQLLSIIEKKKISTSYLLKNNSLGVGCATEGVGLPPCPEVSFLVVLIGPNLRHR